MPKWGWDTGLALCRRTRATARNTHHLHSWFFLIASVKRPSTKSRPMGTHRYQYTGFSLLRATCQMAMKPCVPNRTRVITALMVAISLAIPAQLDDDAYGPNKIHVRCTAEPQPASLAAIHRQHALISSYRTQAHVRARSMRCTKLQWIFRFAVGTHWMICC